MTTIATIGPQGGHAWQAALLHDPGAEILFYHNMEEAISALTKGEADKAIVPVYNTREGESKEFFRLMALSSDLFWVGNILHPIHLSLGAIDEDTPLNLLIGTNGAFRQCEEYIAAYHPHANLMTTANLEEAIQEVWAGGYRDRGVIEAEKILKSGRLVIREREIAAHNKTRFAVLARALAPRTGYDATTMITEPLRDRVGLLYDILGEFSRRGINLIDIRSESDIKTQKLLIFIEAEGHIEDASFAAALARVEKSVLQEPGTIRILGSFPRVDMRVKRIDSFGFIGTGDMSKWFADRLASEGYKIMLSGRSTPLSPEEMIKNVQVLAICVPISVTAETVRRYAPLLSDGQALILLAGEAEETLASALSHTLDGVEVMLVHNLWGPQAATMKDKVAVVVRTAKSGALCSEFESFLYKHGADIYQDSPMRHDLLMGIGQKLPTSISVALAMTLREQDVPPRDVASHATLTSLYGLLAMSRVHSQNPRTYAEIMSTHGDGRRIARKFAENLEKILTLSEAGGIDELCAIIEENREYLTEDFLKAHMTQALAVDEALGRFTRK